MPFIAVAAMINTTVRLALRPTAAPNTFFSTLGLYRCDTLNRDEVEVDHSEQTNEWLRFLLSVGRALQTL